MIMRDGEGVWVRQRGIGGERGGKGEREIWEEGEGREREREYFFFQNKNFII